MSRSIRESAQSSKTTSYDEIPYKSPPVVDCHPDRLATIATLFGARPADASRARVLELGCAAGGNLLPMAEQFPGAEFVGIDLSSRQIDEGREIANALGLTNIDLRHQDLLEFPAEGEPFDYIICHGVYSWVPDQVQRKILEIVKHRLAPNGLAYISYNTYPGWHLREIVRDLMLYRARHFDSIKSQISQARQLLTYLSDTLNSQDAVHGFSLQNEYGNLLKSELEIISERDDAYVAHEHLERCNEPLYFHQFAGRATEAGLQYLGEAKYQVTALDNFPDHIREMLNNIAHDLVEREQYIDFLRNCSFRQSILCHDDVVLNRDVSPEAIVNLWVACPAQTEADQDMIRSSDPVSFRGIKSIVTTNDPVIKAAMMHLGNAWPEPIRFSELAARSLSSATGEAVCVDTEVVGVPASELASSLLRCYARGTVELHACAPTFSKIISQRPRTLALARLQAARQSDVTNGMHNQVALDDLLRHVLRLLDGVNSLNDVEREVAQVVRDGHILLQLDGERVSDEDTLRSIVAQAVPDAIRTLANSALLARETST